MKDFAQIDPTKHPVGQMLVEKLQREEALPYAIRTTEWKTPLKIQPPESDTPRPKESWAGIISSSPTAVVVADDLFTQYHFGCANYFPDGGGMDWHTDSHRPGWRIYAHKLFWGTAMFRYQDKEVEEREGIGAYVFKTGLGCWHSIESHGPRISFGLKIPDGLALEMIEQCGL